MKKIDDFLAEAVEKCPNLDFSLVNDCKSKRFTSEDRKLFCSIKHNWKYDYTKSDFSRVKTKTIVTCKEHGDFEIDYDHHFNSGIGCKYCSYPVRDLESFKKEATKVHKGFYKYNKSIYKDSHTSLIITCPIHGDFTMIPNAHLRGQGCKYCSNGRYLLEDEASEALKENKIEFVHNYKPNWLKTQTKGHLSLDFYIPQIKLAIECQGKQHFGLGGWSKNYDFETQFKRDKLKNEKCLENGTELIYFARDKDAPKEYIGKIFTDVKDLMEYINQIIESSQH